MPKLGRKGGAPFAKGDMTPMIDMTFQLIAFFMVLINFAEADQNQRIHLPDSVLAKPPEAPLENAITLQLTKEGSVILGGEEYPLTAMAGPLLRESQVMRARGKSPSKATVIIRADSDAKTGRVQELIKVCQDTKFEKFALRAKQKERN